MHELQKLCPQVPRMSGVSMGAPQIGQAAAATMASSRCNAAAIQCVRCWTAWCFSSV
jgi:hypothetical protein